MRAVNHRGHCLLALCVGVAMAAPAAASNEVAALCLFPILGVGALVDLASGLVWLLLPCCLGGGTVLGVWGARVSRRSLPYPLLFGLLALALIYAVVVAAGGFGVPDDPNAAVKVGRCVMRAGDVHPAEQVLWLPVATLLGLLAGAVLAAAREATASPLSTAVPPRGSPASATVLSGDPRPRRLTDAAATPTPAPTPTPGPALSLGLRPLTRIPAQPVDAATRARIAAAVARTAGGAAVPAAPSAPPPLPWQREGGASAPDAASPPEGSSDPA